MLTNKQIEKIYRDGVLSLCNPGRFVVSVKRRTLPISRTKMVYVEGVWQYKNTIRTVTYSFERMDEGDERAIIAHFTNETAKRILDPKYPPKK